MRSPTPSLMLLAILINLLCLIPSIRPQTETLPPWRLFSGWVRDMPIIHPDFEGPVAQDRPQTGLLGQNLNSNGMPFFWYPALRNDTQLCSPYVLYSSSQIPQPTVNYCSKYAIANNGHFFYDEWYMDVPGVNVAYNISLNFTLYDSSKAMYRYENDKFFPLDGMFYGQREGIVVTNLEIPEFYRDGIAHNFAFTTEFNLEFYYRGGELFQFEGDDDLWVFVDGNLTSCDIGGLHAAANCTVDLDALNMEVNTTHYMTVLHAERHTDGSKFVVTTSVRPQNRAPTVVNRTAITKEDLPVAVPFQAFDPENDPLIFIITGIPTNGTLRMESTNTTVVNGTMFTASQLQYTPASGTTGNFSVYYIANDGQLNSTIAETTIIVNAKNYPPIPVNATINMTVGETYWININVNSPDTPLTQLDWYITRNGEFGYARLNPKNGTFSYEAVNSGNETIPFEVRDPDGNKGYGQVNVTVLAKPVIIPPPTIPPPVIVGIVFGSIGGVAILGAVLSYFLYFKYAAKKFEAMWQREWQNAQIKENPLFISNVKEQFNPLYQANAE